MGMELLARLGLPAQEFAKPQVETQMAAGGSAGAEKPERVDEIYRLFVVQRVVNDLPVFGSTAVVAVTDRAEVQRAQGRVAGLPHGPQRQAPRPRRDARGGGRRPRRLRRQREGRDHRPARLRARRRPAGQPLRAGGDDRRGGRRDARSSSPRPWSSRATPTSGRSLANEVERRRSLGAAARALSRADGGAPGQRARPLPTRPRPRRRPPSRAAMVSRSGAGPRGVASSAARIAARCAGVVPQQPPMILAPQSRASTA